RKRGGIMILPNEPVTPCACLSEPFTAWDSGCGFGKTSEFQGARDFMDVLGRRAFASQGTRCAPAGRSMSQQHAVTSACLARGCAAATAGLIRRAAYRVC